MPVGLGKIAPATSTAVANATAAQASPPPPPPPPPPRPDPEKLAAGTSQVGVQTGPTGSGGIAMSRDPAQDPVYSWDELRFMLGRDANYATNTASELRDLGRGYAQNVADLSSQGLSTSLGDAANVGNVGTVAGQYGVRGGGALTASGQAAADQLGTYGTGSAAAIRRAGAEGANQMQAVGTDIMATLGGYGQQVGSDLASYGQQTGAGIAQAGTAAGDRVASYGQQIGSQLQARGDQVAQQGMRLGQGVSGVGSGLLSSAGQYANRDAPLANFDEAGTNARLLAELEASQGPSGAQAQLQSGINQAMQNNLALARSGRGLGGNAAALSQAIGQNAGMQQQAVNQAAMLKAQEDAAYRSRAAQNFAAASGLQTGQAQFQAGQTLASRGLDDQSRLAQQAQGLQGIMGGAQIGMQGLGVGAGLQQAGGQLGVGATQAGANLATQANIAGGQLGVGATQAGAGLGLSGLQSGGQLNAALQQAAASQNLQGMVSGGQLGTSALAQGNQQALAAQQAGLGYGLQGMSQQQQAAVQQAALSQGAYQNAIQGQMQTAGLDLSGVQASNDIWQQQNAIDLYRAGLNAQYAGIDAGISVNNAQMQQAQDNAWTSGLFGAGGTALGIGALALMMSDRDAKTGIVELTNEGSSLPISPSVPVDTSGYSAQAGQAAAASGAAQNAYDANQMNSIYGAGLGLAQQGMQNASAAFAPQQPGVDPMTLIAMSDERNKTDIAPIGNTGAPGAAKMAAETKPYSYEYKDPERHGAGRYYGVMAQDLAKTPVGRSTLVQTDAGLGVDTSRLSLANTGALSDQQREISQLRDAVDFLSEKYDRQFGRAA